MLVDCNPVTPLLGFVLDLFSSCSYTVVQQLARFWLTRCGTIVSCYMYNAICSFYCWFTHFFVKAKPFSISTAAVIISVHHFVLPICLFLKLLWFFTAVWYLCTLFNFLSHFVCSSVYIPEVVGWCLLVIAFMGIGNRIYFFTYFFQLSAWVNCIICWWLLKCAWCLAELNDCKTSLGVVALSELNNSVFQVFLYYFSLYVTTFPFWSKRLCRSRNCYFVLCFTLMSLLIALKCIAL